MDSTGVLVEASSSTFGITIGATAFVVVATAFFFVMKYETKVSRRLTYSVVFGILFGLSGVVIGTVYDSGRYEDRTISAVEDSYEVSIQNPDGDSLDYSDLTSDGYQPVLFEHEGMVFQDAMLRKESEGDQVRMTLMVDTDEGASDLQEFDPEMTASPEGDSGLSEVGSGEE